MTDFNTNICRQHGLVFDISIMPFCNAYRFALNIHASTQRPWQSICLNRIPESNRKDATIDEVSKLT